MFDDTIKDQVKGATDIVAVIGQYVTLKKRGANYLGLCPFHTEKTPSFNVHPDRGFFHCFGCSKGGDVFTFLMEHEGWSFPEALKYCADKAGIHLPERREDSDGHARLRQEMLAALTLADETYRRLLFSEAGKPARGYLAKRGFGEATLRKAGVGFAPPGYDTILKTARARGLNAKALEAAGLVATSAKDGNPYDRFRNRITFPIVNLSGRTVGFGARALSDEDQPKYLNSPETELYQKGRILYGLSVTRDAIRRDNRAILVEGYLDWLTMIEFGLDNVVAVSGTALTGPQTELLARFAQRVTLLFDADAAGQRAALRGIDVAFNAGLGVDVAVLPAGDDPDSFLRREGTDKMRAALDSAPDIIEYRLRVARAAQPGTRLDFLVRERLAKEFMELAGLIHDVTRRNAFIGDVAAQLDMGEAPLRKLVHPKSGAASTPAKVSVTPTMTVRREEEFLRVLLEDDAFVGEARAALTPEDFEDPLHQRMFATLAERTAAGIRATSPSDLGPDPEQIAGWSLILSRPFDPAGAERIFADGMQAFRHRRDQADRPRIKEMIAAAERSGDTDTATRLLEQFNRSWRSGE